MGRCGILRERLGAVGRCGPGSFKKSEKRLFSAPRAAQTVSGYGRDAESSWEQHGRQVCLNSMLRSDSAWKKSTQGLPKAAR